MTALAIGVAVFALLAFVLRIPIRISGLGSILVAAVMCWGIGKLILLLVG